MCGNHQQNPVTTTADFPELEQLDQVSTAGSCCSPKTAAAPTPPAAADASAGQDQGDVAECPVMTGTLVNKAHAEAAGLYRDHNGQRYWFCCAACGPMWDADPDEYAAA